MDQHFHCNYCRRSFELNADLTESCGFAYIIYDTQGNMVNMVRCPDCESCMYIAPGKKISQPVPAASRSAYQEANSTVSA